MKTKILILAIFVLSTLSGCISSDSPREINEALEESINTKNAAPCLKLKLGDSRSSCIENFYKAIGDSAVCSGLPLEAQSNCNHYYYITDNCTNEEIDLNCTVFYLMQIKEPYYCDFVGESLREPCFRQYYQQINDPSVCSMLYEEGLFKECQEYYSLS